MRMTSRQKWAYGSGDLGVGLLYITLNTYFFYYLINIAEFSPLSAGIVFLVGRLVDAVTDPIIGARSDALRGSLGRIPFFRRALLPMAVTFVLLFVAPLSPVLPVVAATLAAAAFSVAYTCVAMPYLALLPEIVPSYHERTQVIGIKSVFTMVATLLAFAGPPAIVLALSGAGTSELAASEPSAWVTTVAVLACIGALAMLLVGAVVQEPKGEAFDLDFEKPTTTPMLAQISSVWQATGMREAVWMFLAISVGIMITNSLLAFVLESVIGLPASMLAPVLGGLVLTSIFSFPVWVWLSAKVGKRGALIAALFLGILSLLALVTLVPSGYVSSQLVATVVVNGLATGGIVMFPWAMLPDVVEFDEQATGQRREGLVYAVFTFAQKLATSLGVFANAIVIGYFGYVQGSADQAPETVAALRWLMGPVAAIIFTLAIWLTYRFPITEQLHAAARTGSAHQTA